MDHIMSIDNRKGKHGNFLKSEVEALEKKEYLEEETVPCMCNEKIVEGP